MRALTSEDPPNTEYLVLGPELLSYGEVGTPLQLQSWEMLIFFFFFNFFLVCEQIAEILSEVLGRKIVHVDMSATELQQRHRDFGMPEEWARMLSAMDTSIKFGAENRTNDVVFSVTGAAPRRFKDYAQSVRDVWVKP